MNINIDLQEVSGLESMPDATLSIYGDNLLDEDVYFPELARNNLNTIPIRSGRAAYMKLSIKC